MDRDPHTIVEPTSVVYNNVLLSITDESTVDLTMKLCELYLTEDIVDLEGKRMRKKDRLQALPPVLHIQLQVRMGCTSAPRL